MLGYMQCKRASRVSKLMTNLLRGNYVFLRRIEGDSNLEEYEINSRKLPNYNYEDDTIVRRRPSTEITTQTTRDASSRDLTSRYELG